MEWITAQETAKRWGVSLRYVQALCQKGKIPNVKRIGRDWMLPSDAVRPMDGRTKASKQAHSALAAPKLPLPRKTPFLHMTDLYSKPGSADMSIEALAENQEAQALLAAQIAYSRGQIDQVYASAYDLLHKRSGFYATLAAGMLLALCAIWRGDLALWRQAKIHIAEAPAESDQDRDIMSFSLTAVDSMLYDTSSFPEWFKRGRFEPLHKDALPAAKVFYAKYLYSAAYAVATKQLAVAGVQGLSLMGMVPFTIEPMISQAAADRSVIAEIYLRLTCATIYHNSGNDEQASYHIDRAITMALPDKLYGLLAEYCRVLYSLLELRLIQIDPAVWNEVRRLYVLYNEGWSRLGSSVHGRTIIATLAKKEREVARLAAFGMKNGEIAAKLHMSVSAVKQTISNISGKTGMSREEFAAFL